jgi:hypothetical protein
MIVADMAQNRRASRASATKGSSAMGAILGVFPLIVIPVLIYNIIAFVGGMGNEGALAVREHMAAVAATVPMSSNVTWVVTWGDVLILVSLVLLFIELLKSTSTGASAIFNHALSMIVFIICLVEFLLHPAFATSVFFLIMVMSLLDVLAGVIVTIVSARRDVEFDKTAG